MKKEAYLLTTFSIAGGSMRELTTDAVRAALRVIRACVGIIFLAVALVVPTQAQQPSRLEEIVVTATKREQTLQDVPIAVSVTSGQEIENAEIQDILDLQTIVPSLRVTQLQSSANTNFLIRGFGNGANNAGIEPSVGVFIDGVYRSRSGSAISDLPNIERVEVLRGPQSTLFGKNASAGVISVVTRAPSFENGGYLKATFGDYDQQIFKGFYEGGLTDNLAASIGFTSNTRDGYFTNLFDGSDVNERDRWGVRGQILYAPSDNMEFRLIADTDEISEICCGTANFISNPLLESLFSVLDDGNPATPGYLSETPFGYANYSNIATSNEVENSGISLQADFEFENFTLTSITSVREGTLVTNQDSDFTSVDLIGENTLDLDIDTITQEVRLASNGDGKLDWLVGAFYFDEQVDQRSGIFFGQAFRSYTDALSGNGVTGLEMALGVPAGTFHRNGDGVNDFSGQADTSLSIFAQLDFYLTDRLVATVGANYTTVEKDVYFRQNNTDVFSSLDLVQIGFGSLFGALTGGQAPIPANFAAFPDQFVQAQALSTVPCSATTGPLCNPLLGLQALQFLPPQVQFPNSVEDGNSDDSDTTYTLRLAYDINDQVNVYGSYGTGFKATSWNLSRDSRPFPGSEAALTAAGLTRVNQTFGTRFAEPEESTVIEIGLKAQFERGAINMAIFDQEIKGFQSNIFTGTGFALANAGKQSTQGLELDLLYDITEDLSVTFAGTFLDPTYDSFVGAQTLNGVEDLSGTTPAGIHEISTSTALTYYMELPNGWDGFARADYLYESDVRANENTPESIRRQVNTLNASFGMSTPNGWNILLWGRNLTNDEYFLSSFPTVIQTGNFSVYPNQPRTYGITIRKDF